MSESFSAQTRPSSPPTGGVFDAAFYHATSSDPGVADAKAAIFQSVGIWPSDIVFVRAADLTAGKRTFDFRSSFANAVSALYGYSLLMTIGSVRYDELAKKLGFTADVPVSRVIGSYALMNEVAMRVVRFHLIGNRDAKNASAARRLEETLKFLLRATPIGEIVDRRGAWVVAVP